MNYYPHHIGDFNNATRHLTRVERALYRELIELYYDTEQPLPADDFEWICRKVLVNGQQDRDAVKGILKEFFKLDNDLYRHSRCDREIAAYRAKHEGAIKAGRASAESRANAKSTTVKRTLSKRATNQEPVTKNQEPKEQGIPPNGGSSIWDFGKSLLTEQGLSLSAAGGLMGAWLRDWDEPTVADAIRSAAGKANAKSYIIAILNAKQKKGGSAAPKVDI